MARLHPSSRQCPSLPAMCLKSETYHKNKSNAVNFNLRIVPLHLATSISVAKISSSDDLSLMTDILIWLCCLDTIGPIGESHQILDMRHQKFILKLNCNHNILTFWKIVQNSRFFVVCTAVVSSCRYLFAWSYWVSNWKAEMYSNNVNMFISINYRSKRLYTFVYILFILKLFLIR